MHDPLVSVVVPCFNQGPFLAEAIESVLAQTFPRLEIIVVEDHSTDGLTRDLVRRSVFPRTRIILNDTNRGVAATRNIGIRAARGPSILPLDADASRPREGPVLETASRPLLLTGGDPTRHRQFKIQYCLGRGGYGEVYRATMTSPGNLRAEVALKLLRLDVATHDDAVRRLRDEGRMLGLLQHPAILKVYDLAALEGRGEFVARLLAHPEIRGRLGERKVRALASPAHQLRHVKSIFREALAGSGGASAPPSIRARRKRSARRGK
jgi:glycosyltransferase involved in cell wall biosynthesis